MTLAKYQAKRKFDATPEPKGKLAKGGKTLQFVVQKHAASHLHYDFRLEMDGVLKSWAVPKGPSLDPKVKRLAVQVEDHPFDYLKFEGTIPAGNYGAGEVLVWDIGTYWEEHASEREPDEAKLLAGLAAGKLIIHLKGQKLSGLFDMVQMQGRGENNWLLFKKQDEFASTKDVTKQDNSAISQRKLKDPAPVGTSRGASAKSDTKATSLKPDKRTTPTKAAEPPRRAASKTKIPYPLQPMLATLVDKPFDDDAWIFEVKWDGYRAIGQIEREGKDVRLYSRNANSFADKYPTVVEALAGLKQNCVVDGEIVALGTGGKSSFQLLQNYGNSLQGQIRYVVFDLLFLDGHDLRGLPLVERKRLLQTLLKGSSKTLVYGDHVAVQGEQYFAAADKQGLEGIIAKRADAPYRSGERTTDLLKIKTHQRQEAVIAGFTQPRGARSAFGSLIMGVYDGKRLRYIGHTGTGFDERTLAELHERLTPLISKTCPFTPEPKTNTPATWVKPQLLCEVQFSEWTKDGQMRHPVYLGLREDKPAAQVHQEPRAAADEARAKPSKPAKASKEAQVSPTKPTSTTKTPARKAAASDASPAKPPAAASHHALLPLAPTKAALTHLDKPYWPATGTTKGELLAYYGAVADTMLPYLKDRPESLHRYPGGVDGQAFFQKDVNFKLPPFVKSAQIHSDSNNAKLTWALCQNRDALLFLVNLGCIEINPWNSRVKRLDNPDWTVLDLDPDTNSFDEVIGVAEIARKVLDKLGIEACCKTSGMTGLHIFIPLGAKYTYEQARQFTLLIARRVQQLTPDNTSLERTPTKRKGLIYLDYLQNSAGQTLAAPYSVRPAPAGAQVSTPLKWSELRRGLAPSNFDIFNTLKRLDKVGDLWKPVLGPGIDLAAVVKRMGGEAEEAVQAPGSVKRQTAVS